MAESDILHNRLASLSLQAIVAARRPGASEIGSRSPSALTVRASRERAAAISGGGYQEILGRKVTLFCGTLLEHLHKNLFEERTLLLSRAGKEEALSIFLHIMGDLDAAATLRYSVE